MLRSIRWTLQLWHAGILALALAGFGVTAFYGMSRARYAEVDRELTAAAHAMAAHLHAPPRPRPQPPPPRHGRDDGRPPGGGDPFDLPPGNFEILQTPYDRPPEGPPDGRPDDGPPPERRREDNLRPDQRPEIDVSPEFLGRFGDGDDLPYFVIWRSNGEMLKASLPGLSVPDPGPRPPLGATGPEPSVSRQRGDVREVAAWGPQGHRVVVGRFIRRDQLALRHLAWLLVAAGGGVLALGLAGGWLLSLRVVKPIQSISRTARAISASNLTGRIDIGETASELGALAQVLNAMFERLDAAFQQQARFTADASHELRTPVAVIHSHAELALSRDRSPEEYRRTIETCLRASGRMRGLIDSLLLLARADGGKLELDRRPLDLGQLAAECIGMLQPLAEHRGIHIEMTGSSARVTGDPGRIAQVITNLLTNAIRYNREAGSIRVDVRIAHTFVTLSVADTGVGIGDEDRPHIFERFYRVDKARSREAGGSGLGLAICKSIIEAHGGSIDFTSGPDGTTFTVRLPSEPAANMLIARAEPLFLNA